jgi:hypothetical protein
MAENRNIYKKSALIRMQIARDLYLAKVGEKIPGIQEYAEKLSVSRGIIQQALESVTEDKSVAIEKRGVKGSYLVAAEYKKLYAHTGWGAVTGTMPIPLNPYFTSLATAVCEELKQSEIPFSFAYISGSQKRVEALKNEVCDFMILTKSAARLHMAEHDDLEICAEMKNARYSPEYVLYFTDPDKYQVEDGMRVAIDRACMDQKALTEHICKDKNVEFVEFPFIGFRDVIKEGNVDCLVYRKLDCIDDDKVRDSIGVHAVALEKIDGFHLEAITTPVVLVRKANYGIDRLLKKCFDPQKICEIQKQVLEGNRSMRIY